MVSRKSKRLQKIHSALSFLHRHPISHCCSTLRTRYILRRVPRGLYRFAKNSSLGKCFQGRPVYTLYTFTLLLVLYPYLRWLHHPLFYPPTTRYFSSTHPYFYRLRHDVYKHHVASCIDVHTIIFNFPPSKPIYIHLYSL